MDHKWKLWEQLIHVLHQEGVHLWPGWMLSGNTCPYKSKLNTEAYLFGLSNVRRVALAGCLSFVYEVTFIELQPEIKQVQIWKGRLFLKEVSDWYSSMLYECYFSDHTVKTPYTLSWPLPLNSVKKISRKKLFFLNECDVPLIKNA